MTVTHGRPGSSGGCVLIVAGPIPPSLTRIYWNGRKTARDNQQYSKLQQARPTPPRTQTESRLCSITVPVGLRGLLVLLEEGTARIYKIDYLTGQNKAGINNNLRNSSSLFVACAWRYIRWLECQIFKIVSLVESGSSLFVPSRHLIELRACAD